MGALRNLGIITFFVVCVFALPAQPEIKLKADRDTIFIGDELMVELDIKPGQDLGISALKINLFDSIGLVAYLFPEDSLASASASEVDFEITDAGSWQLGEENNLSVQGGGLMQEDDTGQIQNKIKIKVWDPGDFIILVEALDIYDIDMQQKDYYPDIRHGLLVASIAPQLKETGDIEMQPIKDIIREGRHWSDFKWLYLAVFAIALFIFLITRPIKQRKKQRKKIEKPEIKRPAHEIALEKLSRLRAEELWQKGEIKQFQSELSYIIREYLENRYGVRALESTTMEIVRDLEKQRFGDEDIVKLKELLQISDLVKFARAKPEASVHDRFLDDAFDFINRTKKTVEEDKR
jgi:hypothetical protein